MIVTGSTDNSRLTDLKKYTITNVFEEQYISGGTLTTDGVDYASSPTIDYVVYYIGGIQYLDETLIDGVNTTFSYTPENNGNFNDLTTYAGGKYFNIINNT